MAYHKSCIGCIWVRPLNDKFLQFFGAICRLRDIVRCRFFSFALTVRPSKKGGGVTPKRKATFQLPNHQGMMLSGYQRDRAAWRSREVSFIQFPQAFGRRIRPGGKHWSLGVSEFSLSTKSSFEIEPNVRVILALCSTTMMLILLGDKTLKKVCDEKDSLGVACWKQRAKPVFVGVMSSCIG